MKKQTFAGLKVADFAWVAAGPQVGRELAEHGATVVRVESHRHPDTLRLVPPFLDGKPGIDRSAFGAAFNTQKLGISLDLNMPKGQEVARRLVKWADLVSESMTPGNMAKWGLDYGSCCKIKPDIIYYSTCQMGQHGPLNKFGGYGTYGASYSGYCNFTGLPEREPLPSFNNYSDFIATWYLTSTVIAALLYRRRTGNGVYIDQSQVECGVTFLGPALLDYAVNGRNATRMGNRDPYMAPHGAYPCLGQDRWCSITARTDEEWQALCRVMGNPEWSADAKFSTVLDRKKNEDELDRLIGEWTKDYKSEQLMAMLQRAGVTAGTVSTTEDLFNDPQLKHREHYRFLEHQVIGRHAYNSPAYRLSKAPARIDKAGPCLGEDNQYVYKELLGYTDEEVTELLMEGVITTEHDLPAVMRGR